MKIARLLTVLFGMLAVSACATPFQVADVQDVQNAVPRGGSAFTRTLFDGYREQARIESEVEQEWRHAAIYARKGLRAAAGEEVEPENPATWDLPATADPELPQAHQALSADLAQGARERVPVQAAQAQVAFDCWVEEEAEGETGSACKDTFQTTEKLIQPPPPPPPPVAKVVKTFVVYFDFNDATLDRRANQMIAEAAQARAGLKNASIHVVGHTDTVGTRRYNQKLSVKRAWTVTESLRASGIDATPMDVTGRGKDQVEVDTGDNVREAGNRRVVITVEGEPSDPTPTSVPASPTAPAGDSTMSGIGHAPAAGDMVPPAEGDMVPMTSPPVDGKMAPNGAI